MIYDMLKNICYYRGISVWLDKAIDFLEQTDLNALPLGRTEIFQDKVFANVMEAEAKNENEVEYEIHKKYMDIQIDLEGTEKILIGGIPTGQIRVFEEEIDFGTVVCERAASLIMGPGRFVVCMGQEPHKPGIVVFEEKKLKKCVIKVAVESD